jgi:PAS domain-containing protein
MSPSELHHQRAIFEWQSIGVVESDLEGIVRYANGHAMELLGVSDYEGARLGIFFADQTVLSDQLSSRRAGQIGSYRTIVKRASDDALIPVPVTGIPMTNERGQIVGSFAVLRRRCKRRSIACTRRPAIPTRCCSA